MHKLWHFLLEGTSKNYTFRKPCVVKHRLNKGLNFQSTQKYGFLEVPTIFKSPQPTALIRRDKNRTVSTGLEGG